MKTFAEVMAEDRRLTILRLLHQVPEFEVNEATLAVALHGFGHTRSHDGLRSDLSWLKEQGLIAIEEIADVWIARLTQRGDETAMGIVETPGVKRPGPGSA